LDPQAPPECRFLNPSNEKLPGQDAIDGDHGLTDTENGCGTALLSHGNDSLGVNGVLGNNGASLFSLFISRLISTAMKVSSAVIGF